MRTDQDARTAEGKYVRTYDGTTTERELRLLAAQGCTYREISDLLKLSPGMLRNTLSVLGIKVARQPRRQRTTTVAAWEHGGQTAKSVVALGGNPFGISAHDAHF